MAICHIRVIFAPGAQGTEQPARTDTIGAGDPKLIGGRTMKKMMTALAAVTLVLGAAACTSEPDDTEATASSGIAGTWKADPASAESVNDNRNFMLMGDQFTCNSCIPPYSTTANGEWQKVDRPGTDEVMIEIVDDKTIKSSFRFEGRDLANSTWTVSEDGNSMMQSFVDLDGEETTEGNLTLTRVGDAPEGAHAVSGEWTLSEYGEISEAALLFTYSLDGDTLTSSGNGEGWSAVIGGEPVAIEGSESGVMVQVEKTGDNNYRETYTRDGEVISVSDIAIDGNTMSATSTDPRDNSVFTFSASRQ